MTSTIVDSNARRAIAQAGQVRASLDALGVKAPREARDLIAQADRADYVLTDLQREAQQADTDAQTAALNGDTDALIDAVTRGKSITGAHEVASSHVNATKRGNLRVQAVRAWANAGTSKATEVFEDAGDEFLAVYREEFKSKPIDLASVLESDSVRDAWVRLKDAAARMDHAKAVLDLVTGHNDYDKAPRTLYVRGLAYLHTDAELSKSANPFGEWTRAKELAPVAHWIEAALRDPRPGESIRFAFDPEAAEKDDAVFEQFLTRFSNGGNRPGGHLTNNVAQAARFYWGK